MNPKLSLASPAAFAEVVARQPNHLALIGEDGSSFSYLELDQARRNAAKALITHGIEHGDRVAIWAQNCVEWVIAGLAIHSIGAILVPINTRFKAAEAAYVIEKSGAKLLFCTGNFLGQHYPTLLGSEKPACLNSVIVICSALAGDTDWAGFLAQGQMIDESVVDQRVAAVSAEDTMDIMFTSGTTGLPKGVITKHGQNLGVIFEWCERMAIVPEDRYLVANPFFHAFGYKVGWLGGLLMGCTVMPHAIFDAGAVTERIEKEKISVLPGPPTLFISLLDDPACQARDLSSLRATITGAAAVAPALVDRIREELGFDVVLTGYGLTETCGIVSLCHRDDSAETIVSTCGQVIPDVEARIVDADNQPVAEGESGEICVRGYNIMAGYFDNDTATAETIDADGWLHTGDIGTMDAKGYLNITDRVKDLYICGGFNVYPAEIERMMAAHPAISQVAVVGIPDERMGEVGKAFVVLRPGEAVDEPALIGWCREQMANYKAPRSIKVLDALPMNASGKVLKFELREQA